MRRAEAVTLILLASAAVGVAGLEGCARALPQPLAFNHRLHAQNGVPCLVCHPTATTGQGATLPAVSVCRRCHEDVLFESPEEAKIRVAASSGRGLRWVPVYALRPFVYFSHLRHAGFGKLSCSACHGDVEERSRPFRRASSPFSGAKGMGACIRCHVESHSQYAGVDCVDCHR
jgi:Cytochrome c7 and related cytochrome c